MTVVTIVRLVMGEDMRGWHDFRKSVECKPGEAWMRLNRERTIAEIVDCHHGFMRRYANHGAKYDAARLQQEISGLRLRLGFSAEQEKAIGGKGKKGKRILRRAA